MVRRQGVSTVVAEVAGGRASSMSAWVDQALEEKGRRAELAALLAEMRA